MKILNFLFPKNKIFVKENKKSFWNIQGYSNLYILHVTCFWSEGFVPAPRPMVL